MPETIQGNNDQERLLYIAQTWSTTKKIPKELIVSTSEDGLTVITVHGTKVNDALLAKAQSREKARAAAARAVTGMPEVVVSKDEVQAMINAAVEKALDSQKSAPPK